MNKTKDLQRFREEIEQIEGDDWLLVQAPVYVMLGDVCDALGLNDREKVDVLGARGAEALAALLETRFKVKA